MSRGDLRELLPCDLDARPEVLFARPDVDPDLAECSISQGALTIAFPPNLRCIVSPQPPVRQMWLAFRDRAWHFDWDATRAVWVDDKGRGELYPVLSTIIRETAGLDVTL